MLLKHSPLTLMPSSIPFSASQNFNYTLNNTGDKTQPCLTLRLIETFSKSSPSMSISINFSYSIINFSAWNIASKYIFLLISLIFCTGYH